MSDANLENLAFDDDFVLGPNFSDVEELVSRDLKEKIPEEVAEYFLEAQSRSMQLAIRKYIEKQPRPFREQFDSHILSHFPYDSSPRELARTSGDYEEYGA